MIGLVQRVENVEDNGEKCWLEHFYLIYHTIMTFNNPVFFTRSH